MNPRSRDLIAKAIAEPHRILPALARRVAPSSRFGPNWLRTGDGSVTFREEGFVAAPSRPMLLARHNFESAYIRRLLDGVHAERSLEIGCGFGRLSPVFAEFSDAHLGVDINPAALALARTTYPDLEFRDSSVTALPFEDDRFGLISTWTVVQHVPPDRIERAAAEILRVLAPGGTLLICEETRYPEAPGQHTWHRAVDVYRELFAPLELLFEQDIHEIDRLAGMESPGHVMLFR
jgi:SAM-dependent methyltransferase